MDINQETDFPLFPPHESRSTNFRSALVAGTTLSGSQ